MGMKQYKVGKDWEEDVIDYYYKKGYFTLKWPTMFTGTVFDIIAIKNGGVLAIECKHVTGDKLSFKSSGIEKKYDEIEHFVKTCGTNVYIYIKSDKLNGVYWTTFARSGQLLKEKGHLDLQKDCFKAVLNENNS